MDGITEWIGGAGSGREGHPHPSSPAFTDSRHWPRAAFPDWVAYGFFPKRHQGFFDSWPLIHGADERIDLRDLEFAATFFRDLTKELLG